MSSESEVETETEQSPETEVEETENEHSHSVDIQFTDTVKIREDDLRNELLSGDVHSFPEAIQNLVDEILREDERFDWLSDEEADNIQIDSITELKEPSQSE